MALPNDELAPSTLHTHPSLSLVVGLGASAGGIAALARFFASVRRPDAPIAYVVILHLSPDYDSRLAQVLQSSTSMPVAQVTDATTLEPGCVYVIPPNRRMRVAGGMLALEPIRGPEDRRGTVDLFFRTLADAYGARAAAVVLSGTGPDGSNGLKRVKERGGLTVAQDPADAEYREMPEKSIATRLVDYVLPVAEIPDRILEYVDGFPQAARVALAESPRAPSGDAVLSQILTLLRLRTGHDFANYKLPTLQRRIARRLLVRGLTSLEEYSSLMREDPGEASALMRELLISVTNFFRDPAAWAVLERRVLPSLVDRRRNAEQVRVWSAGCATGEEAYGLAMLLLEQAAACDGYPPAIQVFGSDLDEAAIAVAREGVYSEADLLDVRPGRVERFFQREARGFRVRREIRDIVIFAQHNIIKDPPFSYLDLIACRNVLIYLNQPIQERVLETFHFALRSGGYLFLGTSESPEASSELFITLDKDAHIYESATAASRLTLPIGERIAVPPAPYARLPHARSNDSMSPGDLHLQLLEQLAPPSLVVNEEHTLVHTSESAARFLQMRGGEPSRDLFKLIHPDLRVDVRMALRQAAQTHVPAEVRGAQVSLESGTRSVTIIVRPFLRQDEPPRGYLLVCFQEEDRTPQPEQRIRIARPVGTAAAGHDEELMRLKSELRSTIEQYETQVEESKAANEELQAMNEELRSAAEELETSKEELQSVNEELATVNQELKIKVAELAITSNDFENLINSTDIGTIFLDRDLQVKFLTPRARDVFNLAARDIGRKLTDITSHIGYDDLVEDVTRVLRRLQAVEREVAGRDGGCYLLRIVPYRTTDDRIDGVVLTFQDITARHEVEMRVRRSEERLRLLIDGALDYAIFTMSEDGVIDFWNQGAQRVFGYAVEEILGQQAAVLFTPEDRAAGIPGRELATARISGRALDERWYVRKDGTRLYCSGATTRLGPGAGLGFARIARDLTAVRESSLALEQAHAELDDRVRQRTADLNAEVARHAAAQERATSLMRRLVRAQEDQRTRIARDLHDQLGQQLTALRLALEHHRSECPSTDGDLDRALEMAAGIDAEVDFLAWELRPAALDDLGLAAALPRFVQEWSSHYGIEARFQIMGPVDDLVTPELEITYYRIAQEALNNVLKHAHARHVDVVLERREDALVMVIEDDGIGFDPNDPPGDQKGIGVTGMRERAALVGARLEIESATGKGTAVFVSYPAVEGQSRRARPAGP